MKIILIPEKTSLIMTFTYKEKEYNLEVNTIKKNMDTLYITAICNHDKPLTCKELSNISITYLVENGYYVFKNLKFDLIKIGNIYAYVIKNNFESERINRRDSFRVFIGDILKVKITTTDGEVFEHSGVLKDLSTIGMGIILNKQIPNVKELEIYFASDNLKVQLRGDCVRCRQIEGRRDFIYGCRFHDRSEILSRFVLSRQIKNKLSKDFYNK